MLPAHFAGQHFLISGKEAYFFTAGSINLPFFWYT